MTNIFRMVWNHQLVIVYHYGVYLTHLGSTYSGFLYQGQIMLLFLGWHPGIVFYWDPQAFLAGKPVMKGPPRFKATTRIVRIRTLVWWRMNLYNMIRLFIYIFQEKSWWTIYFVHVSRLDYKCVLSLLVNPPKTWHVCFTVFGIPKKSKNPDPSRKLIDGQNLPSPGHRSIDIIGGNPRDLRTYLDP